MPSREATALIALQSLLPQFDHIFLVLNNFQRVPDWAKHSKITTRLTTQDEDLGAAGKLWGLQGISSLDKTLYYCVDDDILYPPNFAKRLADLVKRKPNALVGVHGSDIIEPHRSWRSDRRVYWLQDRLRRSRQVDVVATCGCAFRPDRFLIDPQHWPPQHRNRVDIYLALLAQQQGIQQWIISRGKGWLRELANSQTDSIYAALLANDREHTLLAHEYLQLKNRVDSNAS